MIQTVLTELGNYLLTKSPTFLKAIYTNVTIEDLGADRKGEDLGVFPVYWVAGSNEGKTLLNDSQLNYGYFRQTGDAISEEGRQLSSRSGEVIDTYPMRFLCHYLEPQGGNTTDSLIYLYRQWFEGFSPDSLSQYGITRINIDVQGHSPMKDRILDEEMRPEMLRLPMSHRMFVIDFAVSFAYNSGTCTAPTPEGICL